MHPRTDREKGREHPGASSRGNTAVHAAEHKQKIRNDEELTVALVHARPHLPRSQTSEPQSPAPRRGVTLARSYAFASTLSVTLGTKTILFSDLTLAVAFRPRH